MAWSIEKMKKMIESSPQDKANAAASSLGGQSGKAVSAIRKRNAELKKALGK